MASLTTAAGTLHCGRMLSATEKPRRISIGLSYKNGRLKPFQNRNVKPPRAEADRPVQTERADDTAFLRMSIRCQSWIPIILPSSIICWTYAKHGCAVMILTGSGSMLRMSFRTHFAGSFIGGCAVLKKTFTYSEKYGAMPCRGCAAASWIR